MTIINVDGLYKKKTLIYILAACFVVILLVAAILLAFFITWTHHDDSEHWSYKDQAKWPGVCTTAKMQSPIALNQGLAFKSQIPAIELENFQNCDCLQLKNNGHSVEVSIPQVCNCQRPKLSGGGLIQNYTFENFHFHWPSEHIIDGLSYDLEAHFVFFADKYENFDEALNHPFGITVMAVLFLENNYTTNDNFRILANAVKTVSSKPGESTSVAKSINFSEFLPDDHSEFFAYTGSLTTPECIEYVNWIVYQSHSNISSLDREELTYIFDTEHELLLANNRSLQDINDRKIYIQSIPG